IEELRMEDLKAIGHHYLPVLDKCKMSDHGADYVYLGSHYPPFMLANGTRALLDAPAWQTAPDRMNAYPLFTTGQYLAADDRHPALNFVRAADGELNDALLNALRDDPTAVLLLRTNNAHAMPALRRAFVTLMNAKVDAPVVIERAYAERPEMPLQVDAATDAGGLLIDGLGDGLLLNTAALPDLPKADLLNRARLYNSTAFNILQAARTRMSKTEYISCPSCGRTLFDLQETTAMIRRRTDHLKGVKIGIMGCIVNGPGEMADADYGYVGVGRGKIALYRGQNVVKKFVPAERAVDDLIELIREDGRWREAN
ncbi:MAG: flavodoxin-dependent (E)-4-hydroxy-3-methylbut-2-enyl-diphosphate synthase, partial [Catalinimonas sp.]